MQHIVIEVTLHGTQYTTDQAVELVRASLDRAGANVIGVKEQGAPDPEPTKKKASAKKPTARKKSAARKRSADRTGKTTRSR